MKISQLPEKAQKLHAKKLKANKVKSSMTASEYEKYLADLMAESKCETVKTVYINEPVVLKEKHTETIIERESEPLKAKIELLENQVFGYQETIEELQKELNKYKQACIELDSEVTKRDNVIGEMKAEKYNLEQTIDTKKIELSSVANELDITRKEKQKLIDNPIIETKEVEIEKIVYKDLSEKPKVSFIDKIFRRDKNATKKESEQKSI